MVVILLYGCSDLDLKKSNNKPATSESVPFIVFSDNKAYEATWDTENADFVISDTYYYEYNKIENKYDYMPVLWDGRKDIVFLSETISGIRDLNVSYLEDGGITMPLTAGKNAKAFPLKNFSGYEIQINIEGEKRNVVLNAESANCDGETYSLDYSRIFLSFIGCSGDNLTMVFSDFDFFKMLIAVYSTTDNSWKFKLLNSAPFEDEHARSFPIEPNSCVLVENKFYYNYGGELACLDLNDFRVELLNDITNKAWELIGIMDTEDVDAGKVAPAGSFGDIVLLYLPVSSGYYNENLWIAFRDKECLGALRVKDDQYTLYDPQGNKSSTYANITYDAIAFPRNSNIVYNS